MSARPWQPLRAQGAYARPSVGALVALEHAVWRVADIRDLRMDAPETAAWSRAGMPAAWDRRPADVVLHHVAGALPGWLDDLSGWDRQAIVRHRPVHELHTWNSYPGGRWPQCSCCGEPMPCRAELQEKEISTGMRAVERWARVAAGHCWACAQAITGRQKAVAYDGDNVDFPGGITPVFHLKMPCRAEAVEYERRWVAADPTRVRILTWPHCTGHLIVHFDGSSQCQGPARAPGCAGHLTHDHGSESACYSAMRGGCPRGCPTDGHPGIRCTPRPARGPAQLPLTPNTGS